jgi:hypothetical protein
MEFSFNCGTIMQHRNNSRIRRIAFAAFMLSMAWDTLARADDMLDRSVQFNVAPAALGNALVDFSTQSGVQVAVADSDVSQLKSVGVTGAYTVRQALGILLRGTGLEFSRVGDKTVAIRVAATPPAVPAVLRTNRPSVAAAAAAATPPADAVGMGGANSQLPDVTVMAPIPPTEQQLAGNSLYQFILHHATTHYPASDAVRGSLARWRGGRAETICPVTVGLDKGYNDFLTARLRALAVYAGAPLDADPNCKDNVRILFTTNPEKLMGEVMNWAGHTLGIRYPHQIEKTLAYSGTHAIQGWYVTANGGQSILNRDAALIGHLDLLPVWPLVTNTGLNGGGGRFAGIAGMIIVVDTTEVEGYTIGTIADYISMLVLTHVQTPDHCDPLPSILDLMSSTCGAREKPAAMTAGDLAFLKALYFHNTGIGPTLSRDDIQINMLQQFKGR